MSSCHAQAEVLTSMLMTCEKFQKDVEESSLAIECGFYFGTDNLLSASNCVSLLCFNCAVAACVFDVISALDWVLTCIDLTCSVPPFNPSRSRALTLSHCLAVPTAVCG
jgi:hypothetical protein